MPDHSLGDQWRCKKRRQKRVFSCESCRRLKCKCEYDFRLHTCRRCKALRKDCSLGEQEKPQIDHSDNAHDDRPSRDNDLADIRAILTDLRREVHDLRAHLQPDDASPRRAPPAPPLPPEAPEMDADELPDPADGSARAAPIVVMREISFQCTGDQKRGLDDTNLDPVAAGLLAETTANELVQFSLRYQCHPRALYLQDDTAPSQQLRRASAFLFGVCCLHGIAYHVGLRGSDTHRQIYERMRVALGQALVSSPLTLAEISGILLMSDNVKDPVAAESQYNDSWLLTGYCAQQAMLSIDFGAILARVRLGRASSADRRAILLWTTICLQNLCWAATTGRPSGIHGDYLSQCNILLSFYEASIHDGMLVAEVALSTLLMDKLKGPLSTQSEDVVFASWKTKWEHLFEHPRAAKLRLAYTLACLVLAVKSLDGLGERLRSSAFFDALWLEADQPSPPAPPAPEDGQRRQLRTRAAEYGLSAMQAFVDMPPALRDTLGTNRYLCVGYSALILARYGAIDTDEQQQKCLRLFARLCDWGCLTPERSWMLKFGHLAEQKLRTRVAHKSSPSLAPPNFPSGEAANGAADWPHGVSGDLPSLADITRVSSVRMMPMFLPLFPFS